MRSGSTGSASRTPLRLPALGGTAGRGGVRGVVLAVGSRRLPGRRREPRQCHEREVQRVHVIFKVEYLREAGAGELVLVPLAARPLRGQQVLDAGVPLGAVGLAGG